MFILILGAENEILKRINQLLKLPPINLFAMIVILRCKIKLYFIGRGGLERSRKNPCELYHKRYGSNYKNQW